MTTQKKINKEDLKAGEKYKHPTLTGELEFITEEFLMENFFRFKSDFCEKVILHESVLRNLVPIKE
jgi:hypothetical protein